MWTKDIIGYKVILEDELILHDWTKKREMDTASFLLWRSNKKIASENCICKFKYFTVNVFYIW